ncbi:uncharacterized protein LOC133821909 [Humulus lupulus]|uniref:uncharacterized protein LOC133821909 n=1 Tax=Humulus lupulus TaxID=3486 RepID=UPI002B40D856|nr:uncharacterized protein LOC133821909 [Humulus lupulus]
MQSSPKNNKSFSAPKKKKQSTTKPITLSPQTHPQSLSNSPFKFKFKAFNFTTIKENPYRTTTDLKTMAALQRFKLLATQCGVTQSPTRSPRTSPVVHLRRRKTTLRMLLGRSKTVNYRSPPRHGNSNSSPSSSVIERFRLLKAAPPEKSPPVKRNSLKELFGSSSPMEVEGEGVYKENRLSVMVSGGGGLTGLQSGSGSPRPGWSGFRYRSLLRRAWRPMLVSIPE